jgi:tetratricopeptide (TPR) repeat protein
VRHWEESGESAQALAFLLEFANLHPAHPDRAAALLKAAALARQLGQIDQAVKVYTLTASLYPGTQTFTQASVAALTLKLYRELPEKDPLSTFRQFLEGLAALSGPIPPEDLAEPLEAGWSAVSRTLQSRAPVSPAFLEEVLLLWDLHPQGAPLPAGALLVARLLREQGLHTQAAAILVRLWENGPSAVHHQVLFDLVDMAFGARGLAGVAESLAKLPGKQPERDAVLQAWFCRLLGQPAPGECSREQGEKLGQEMLAWVTEARQKSGQALVSAHLLERLLQRPWPKPLQEKLLLEMGNLNWSLGRFARAAQVYQNLLDHQPSADVAAFCQDRLALSRLKDGSLESAQELYQGLAKAGDQFWQLLAQTRLMDLELARLKTEPSP